MNLDFLTWFPEHFRKYLTLVRPRNVITTFIPKAEIYFIERPWKFYLKKASFDFGES